MSGKSTGFTKLVLKTIIFKTKPSSKINQSQGSVDV